MPVRQLPVGRENVPCQVIVPIVKVMSPGIIKPALTAAVADTNHQQQLSVKPARLPVAGRVPVRWTAAVIRRQQEWPGIHLNAAETEPVAAERWLI